MADNNLDNLKYYREAIKFDSTDIWDNDLNLAENCMELLNQSVILPHHKMQAEMLITYILAPSGLCSVLPVLFLFGQAGTGKSNAILLASGIHNSPVLSAASTFAGIRNQIKDMRFTEDEIERNYCLIFDNLAVSSFDDDFLFLLFLNGYNRSTDTIQMSKGGGESIIFRVFGSKVVSTVFANLLDNAKYKELARRLLPIRFKKWERFSDIEKAQSKLSSITERLNLESVNFEKFRLEFQNFWNSDTNLGQFVTQRRLLEQVGKKLKLESHFDSGRWTISADLIATGVTLRIWKNLHEAIDSFSLFWKLQEEEPITQGGAIVRACELIIEEELSNILSTNARLGYEAIPVELSPRLLKDKLTELSNQGKLDVVPTPKNINLAMNDLGWRLNPNKNNDMTWQKAN